MDNSSNALDFRVGDGLEPVPALAEQAHESARPVDLEIARLVHRVTQEEIASEERDAREPPDPTPSTPRLDGGEEHLKALRGELIRDELLAIAAGPQDAPARGHRFHRDLCQGFAPFGLRPSLGARPTLSASVTRPRESGRVAAPPSPLPRVTGFSRSRRPLFRVLCSKKCDAASRCRNPSTDGERRG